MTTRFLAPLVLVLAATPAHAQPSPDEIARAIRDLSSPRFKVREKASALLWSGGRQAERAILRALAKSDLETARRAEKVLEKFRWGIYPDTPKEVLTLIARYRGGAPADRTGILQELFRRGRGHYRLISRLLAAEATPEQRGQVATVFLRTEVEEALRKRLREHDFAGLEDLLEIRVFNSTEKTAHDYAFFLLLTGHLERAIEDLADIAELPGHQREARLLAYLYRVKGELFAARRAAEKTGDQELVQTILVEQGDWKALSARAKELVGEFALPDFQAFFHRLAGNQAAYEQAVAELVKVVRSKNPGDGTLWWEAKALFLNDRTEDALAALEQGENDEGIVDVLVRQRRFDEAFRRLERYASHGGKRKLMATVRRAQLLHYLGDSETARKSLDEIREAAANEFLPQVHFRLLKAEREMGRLDDALRLCARLLERYPPRTLQPAGSDLSPAQYAQALLCSVFARDTNEPRCWWPFLRQMHTHPGILGLPFPEKTLTTLQRLRRIFDEKMPQEEFTALVREARTTALRRPAERDDWLIALAETCRRVDRDDLRHECLEASAKVAERPYTSVALAKFLAGKKRWADVAKVCARACKRFPDDGVLALLHGHALTQSGRAAEGRKLEQTARLLPLGDEHARQELAETLAELGRHDEARREFELVTHSRRGLAWSTREAWRQLSAYAARAGDDLRAAACWERWYLGVIGRGSFFLAHEPYVWVPYRLHFLRARGLLAKADVPAALAEIRLCQQLLPNETATAVAFVPMLSQRGRKREADELFARSYASHQALCKEYPGCAALHNGLAWLAARCRRQLDAVLEHARAAVRLAPDNASFLDTLAEVYFQRGERDEALRLMRRCIELVPAREYYRNQLRRFEAGDRSAEVKE